MADLTGPQMRAAILEHWRCKGGTLWMSGAAVFDDAFPDHDKVKFSLALSDLVLKGEHELVRRKDQGVAGYLYRLRQPYDEAWVEPEKKPRAKKVVELPAVVSSVQMPVEPPPAPYVRPGNVAQTPAEVRKLEPDTMPVVHHILSPAPANNAFAAALAKAKAPVAKPPPVAKVSVNVKQEQSVEGMLHVTPAPTVFPPELDERRPAPQPTFGSLLDSFLALAKPLLTDLIVEAMTSPRVLEKLSAQLQSLAPVVGAEAQRGTVASAPAPSTHDPVVAAPASADPIPRHNPFGAIQPKTRRPKVTIVGMPDKAWEREINDSFEKKLDMTFVHADVNRRIIRKYCENAERVIVMNNFVSHGVTQSLKSYSIPFTPIVGGTNKLKEQLRVINP